MAAKTPTPKQALPANARTCAVNSPIWATLIPDQPECKRPTARPASALCQQHEKKLPAGWRKRFNEVRAERRTRCEAAKAAKPKAVSSATNPLLRKRVSAKARRDEYAAIVARLEAEGATTSDAQAGADVEVHERGMCDTKTCPLHLAAKPKAR
jgi:hypothetical protein